VVDERPGIELGIDLGTTFTAAALVRDGRVEPVALGGSHGTAIPTVLHLAGDRMLVGVDAARRAATEPELVVREFKRRVGDPTPIVVGDRTVTAEDLMVRLAVWVVDQVTTTEGAPPRATALTHPANWGDHKKELLQAALARAGVQIDRLVPEPVAAAHYYAAQRRLAPGSLLAVYDLGGGTFDAAVVEVAETGCALKGRPDGIERLGGIDVDEAVFGHVLRTLQVEPDSLDPADPATVAAVARLRRSCVEAKEALSDTTEVTIPVMLPELHTEVRLTRAELEGMIRPALDETLVALRRAVEGAGITVDDLTAVLLVGGSSRIPLVEQMVTAQLGRPVATDARPKDAVSMGAAFVAAEADPVVTREAEASVATPGLPPPPPTTGPVPVVAGPPPPPTTGPVPVVPGPPPTTGPTPAVAASPGPRRRRRRLVPLAVGLVVVVAAVAGGLVLAGGGGDEASDAAPPADAPAPTDAPTTSAPGAVEPGDNGEVADTADRAIAGNYDLSGLTVNIGWLDTDDQFILANIAAHAMEEAGATVEGEGPTMAVGAEALRNELVDGNVDIYWDYQGRPAGLDDFEVPTGIPAGGLRQELNRLDRPNGLVWLDPADFTLEYGLAMRRDEAEALGVESIADVERLIQEDPRSATVCFDIEEALRDLEATYGFRFTRPVFVPYPQDIYPALASGDCTFAEVFSAIDPAMAELDLVVLEDNRTHFVPMNPAPRLRTETLEENPELEDLFAAITAELDDDAMAELMARVVLDGELAADVALDWLVQEGFVTP
jgi:glycine betaine/choline ABC-type transport system substrate-binding protein/actin-like ATPase involved in cell morphogenesis